MPLHNSHGWLDAVNAIQAKLNNPNGVLFYDMLDFHFIEKRTPIQTQWTGFFHSVPKYPENVHNIARLHAGRLYMLSAILEQEWVRESLPYCVGLFTLSPALSRFIVEKTGIPVSTIPYAVSEYDCQFDIKAYDENPRVLHAGQYQRNYQPFFDLKVKQKKTFIKIDFDKEAGFYTNTEGTEFLELQSAEQFIKMQSSSVVFMNHYNEFACTVMLQCIKLRTPVMVNPTETNRYYLGEDYPLFYSSVEEANAKLADHDLIVKAHEYLKGLSYTTDRMVDEIANSKVYKSIGTRFVF
jgi:hypothetical protein